MTFFTTATTTLLVLLMAASSNACGGFFCSRSQLVIQQGENILFHMDGNKVTATIQIQYSGEADKFSWVLPLPSTPDQFGVSSDVLFAGLHATTQPSFTLRAEGPKDCKMADEPCPLPPSVAFGNRNDEADGGGGVQVLKKGEVGPYVYTVIAAKADDTDGTALFEWLNANGYDQPDMSKPIIKRYVANRHRFVTLKLQKGISAGALVPIVLTYTAPTSVAMSCVPLRLTAIAATNNMPIYIWIAGPSRAVPTNFVHIMPDLAALPWEYCARTGEQNFGGGAFAGGGVIRPPPFGGSTQCLTEYRKLLADTAKEFGIGRYLTTEYAGAKPDGLLNRVWNKDAPPFMEDELAAMSEIGPFVQTARRMLAAIATQAQMTETFKKHFPMGVAGTTPGCNDESRYYAPFSGCIEQDHASFDPVAVAKAMDAERAKPVREARRHLEEFPYLTRLYTSLSPDNMNRDPIFRFAPQGRLPDVSNQHTAVAKYSVCPKDSSEEFSVEMQLPGDVTRTVEKVRLAQCGGALIFPREGGVNPVPPPISLETSVAQVLETTGAADAVKLEIKAFATKADAVAADKQLKDDVVGVEYTPSEQCNAGSLDCACMQGTCAKGLACRTANMIEKCVVDDGSGDTAPSPADGDDSRASTLAAVGVAAALAALIATVL